MIAKPEIHELGAMDADPEELEALLAIYDTCHVISRHPLHVAVDLKPHTAEDHTQQFVEMTLELRATEKYPEEMLELTVLRQKGLSEKSQNILVEKLTAFMNKNIGQDMFVGTFEEAIEVLTELNFPDGECSICKESFVDKNVGTDFTTSVFKLLSCFHCYHLDCFKEYWMWHLKNEEEKENIEKKLKKEIEQRIKINTMNDEFDVNGNSSEYFIKRKIKMLCTICRNEIQISDIAHILHFLDLEEKENDDKSQLDSDHETWKEIEKVFNSKSENDKREKFKSIVESQRKKGGVFENRKIEIKADEFELYFENNRSNYAIEEEQTDLHSTSDSNENKRGSFAASSEMSSSPDSKVQVLEEVPLAKLQLTEHPLEGEVVLEEDRKWSEGEDSKAMLSENKEAEYSRVKETGINRDGKKGEGRCAHEKQRGRGRGRGWGGRGRGRIWKVEKGKEEVAFRVETVKKHEGSCGEHRVDDDAKVNEKNAGEVEGKGKEKSHDRKGTFSRKREGWRGGRGRGEEMIESHRIHL